MDNRKNVLTSWLTEQLQQQKGNVSFLYKNLHSGETLEYHPGTVHPSASVIKMFLMAYMFELEKQGKIRMTDRCAVDPDRNASSSGILHFMKDIPDMSVRDLIELMIIVSDNTATNILLRIEGMEKMQRYLAEDLKLTDTRWNREMMDLDAIEKGIQNYTSARECAWLLEKIYKRELISADASEKMLQVLKEQQFNDLISEILYDELNLPEGCVAHKSGGLEGVVHDVGIVDYGKDPFILCFLGDHTDVPEYASLMREASRRIYEYVNPCTNDVKVL